jgi:hypothetical protein
MWRVLAGSLIALAAGLHVAYLACACPLDLAPDEAHYWDWSRHLDWSYYSKGPLVAYLIRGGCALAASWSQAYPASDVLAVRLPAVLCGSLLLMSLYVLTVQVYGRERLAAAVVALALTLPVVAAGSSLMTIDAPYTCCWGWALVLGHQALFRGRAWAWPALGVVIGLGILAKYTMVLWVPSVGLFLLTSPEHRRMLAGRGFWVMSAVAALCCVPVVWWNAAHGWVSVRHVGGLAGVHAETGIRWLGPLGFLGGQCGLLLGFWFVAWLAAMTAHRPWHEPDPKVRYLWWMSAPTFGLFLLASLRTAGQLNWPVAAYVSGLVLTAGWVARLLWSPRAWVRRLTAAGVLTACAVGLAVSVAMHDTRSLQALLLRLSGPVTESRPFPLRRFDPTCRLRGWRHLAEEVDRVRAELRAQGIEPVLAASAWTLPGELSFYCAGHPEVYSLGLALGDRWSQYDFWRPNPVWDADRYQDRTFVFVGIINTALREAFEQVDPPRLIFYREGDQPIACWAVTVCRGFRGFPQVPELMKGGRF